MKNILTVSEMRQAENRIFSRGVSEFELMQRAVKAILPFLDKSRKTLFVCGNGNNAGDALGVAYEMKKLGCDVAVALISENLKPCAEQYFEACKSAGVSIFSVSEVDFCKFDCIVDGIFGIGFHGEPNEAVSSIIERINSSGKTVISIDVPSGLNADSGLCSVAVKSHLNIAVGALKTGLVINQAQDYIERNVVADIGVDSFSDTFLVEVEDFKSVLFDRPYFCHKGTFGYVGIMGGSKSYSGAVKLANLSVSQLRSGAGVSRLIVPDCIADSVMPYLDVSTLSTLPDNGEHAVFDEMAINEALKGLKVLTVGTGMTDNDDTTRIILHILENYAITLVIDADGINALKNIDKSIFKTTRCRVVLTPHVKEFSRISGLSTNEIVANPVQTAKDFASTYGVILLLKGTATVVTDGKETLICNRGAAGMATAGSGDVLDGIISGILGYNEASVLSVCCGAYVNGLAGEMAEAEVGAISCMSSDTVKHIHQAINALVK